MKYQERKRMNEGAKFSIKKSIKGSIGDIVFGMEDGTVSVFGLVFGMALSVKEHDVLLAGIAGGAAGAISMMAGAYLDAKSERDAEKKLKSEITGSDTTTASANLDSITNALKGANVDEQDIASISSIIKKNPRISIAIEEAFKENETLYRSSPFVQSIWMLIADMIASAIPILPFFFADLSTARIWSICVTSLLLIVLGVGRSRITKSGVIKTVLETVVIAYAAAIGGILLIKLFHMSAF